MIGQTLGHYRIAENPFLHICEFALLFEKLLYRHYLCTPHSRLGTSSLVACHSTTWRAGNSV